MKFEEVFSYFNKKYFLVSYIFIFINFDMLKVQSMLLNKLLNCEKFLLCFMLLVVIPSQKNVHLKVTKVLTGTNKL